MALTTVSELQTIITRHISDKPHQLESETLPLPQLLGRVLASDIVSPINVPNQNVSAMDGYALPRAAKAGEQFDLVGESVAGKPFSGSLKTNQAIRIMTGAVVPDDGVTVVMQENTETVSGSLNILHDTPERNNIRYRGEEVAQGQTVLTRGRTLHEADIMLLAALGITQVAVYRRLRVAILSTGDELVEAGTPLTNDAQIYDSNRPMLYARLQNLPIEIIDLGKVQDSLSHIKDALAFAAQNADVIITSGGVSVGDYDYLRQAVEEIGQIHHYKVAMKPGKPFVFGQLGGWYFGLPGNPISGFVGFDMFIKPALWQLCGATPIPKPIRFQAALTAPVKKAPGRMDIQRAIITQHSDGTWTAAPTGTAQDSHRILGTSRANAYLLLPLESGSLKIGDIVEVQPFATHFL